ncbi:MAG: DUF2065 domain-containing protein [Pseudomonadales bacterium]|jgi:uncharacterized protein YjeT (DUF2065 family)|nr:DUF2065 domain-containing protein [Pseudomonadales bacterium]MDG1938033.1 DUF2065 domain-containing protein [Pseudomonadales bacterium]MDG2036163.1 DUF2065 domain-containing protein [Pseudomonadales bacterium]
MWQELIVAACLVLVLEGMLPFIAPQKWRAMLANILTLSDSTIRRIGLASMITGVILLYILN